MGLGTERWQHITHAETRGVADRSVSARVGSVWLNSGSFNSRPWTRYSTFRASVSSSFKCGY